MIVTIIYGSDGGATKGVASKISKKTKGRVVDIKAASASDFEGCDLLILGSPTYGAGDLQMDWEAHVDTLKSSNLDGKKVALFGTGDQATYPDSFVDAMGVLYDLVVEQGAQVVGFTDTAGYDFTGSFAERDGQFVGLALDQDGQSSLTEKRVTAWLATIL
ncbi:flavodoxin FldA [Aquabacter sp. L1I39]|uniref:flavodoxin FldA n=1 Tax=Aquabacter sp. L1I39 TaxID=2820278 RepID=UPI001ADBFD7F|nr:flavodoxin FldA [Aquabacter sp. L1I39]QTL05360.1 flavodoxin FldA [Aquabacter sp. L1I39]